MAKKKFWLRVLVMVFGISVVGCAAAPSSQRIVLPDWHEEQAVAQYVLRTQYIASASIALRRHINNIWTYFAYEAYLFDKPVKLGVAGEQIMKNRGLQNIGFPRSGSTDNLIMWESINSFKARVGARPGDYFSIYISRLTSEDFNRASWGDPPVFLFFVGRIEANNSITGSIWRRP